MAEERKRRRTRDNSHAAEAAEARVANMKVGEQLKHAREAKKLDLDEISSSIHVRVAQLKAIEEGHIESLPGMTYALGFVKSYATYLKLDPIEIVQKFKAEHGQAPAKPELHFPEPLGESKMPDPVMLGVAAAGVFIILALWAIFSGGDEKTGDLAAAIPLPPADTGTGITGSVITPPAATADNSGLLGNITDPTTPAVPPVDAEAIATGTAPAVAPVPVEGLVVPKPKPLVPAQTQAAAPPVETVTTTTTTTATGYTQQQQQQQTQPVAAAAAPASEVINVKPGRSRIQFQAKETSWVQINNPDGTVYKKLLRAGETIYAPEGPGSSITTTNAGGLDVYVDGQKVRALGGKGDIIKEKLDAERLKRRAVSPSAARPVRDY
ncbi:MAG: RodZ domain-containing protein [Alphaproteobacteria bacterium]